MGPGTTEGRKATSIVLYCRLCHESKLVANQRNVPLNETCHAGLLELLGVQFGCEHSLTSFNLDGIAEFQVATTQRGTKICNPDKGCLLVKIPNFNRDKDGREENPNIILQCSPQ